MLTLPIKKKWFDMILLGEKNGRVQGDKALLDNQVYESF